MNPMTLFFGIALINAVAVNLVHPVTPALLLQLGLPAYVFGTAYAAMSFMNFLFSPFWGKLRDFVSLRWLLLIGSLGYGIGQYLFSIAVTQTDVILARCCAGLFYGAVGVASLIYITENAPNGKSGSYLARYVIVQTLGAAIGYLVGGAIGGVSISYAFVIQALTMSTSGLLFFALLRDARVLRKTKVDMQFLRSINPLKVFWDCRSFLTRDLIVLFGVTSLSSLATSAFDQSFNYYLRAQFDLPPVANGLLKAVTGLITLTVVGTVCMWIMRRANIRPATSLVAALCAASALAMLWIDGRIPFMVVALAYFSLNAVYTPLVQDCVAREASGSNRSMMMAFLNATRSLGMIAGALFAGFLYGLSPQYPFVLAVVCFGLAAAALFAARRGGVRV